MSEKMIEQFMEMVKIDSESGHEAEMIEYLYQEFTKLGGKAVKDDYGNLVAKFAAKGCSGKDAILFSCHADTVLPGKGIKPALKDGVIRSEGDTILAADDKAGIAELMEALRTAPAYPPLEISISRQEEVGLLGVKNLDYSLISAKKGFLLDNDTLDTIVIGGPSYFALDVDIKGRSAHAGMEPEKGINAIQAAARAIASLELGRLDADTTANVGVIKGGIIRNGVPDACSFLAECRSLDHDKGQALADMMVETITTEVESFGAFVEVKVDNLCLAVDIPEDSPTVLLAKKALKTVGIEAHTTFITGFTDASIYNNRGIEMAVVGIGARMEHSTEEHIHVEDMEKARKMIVEIMRLCAQ
ncbi:MAG: M20/M25/M40 family metallo-hydrolase [Candidatus Krumholzibacteriota bacterium]|nr:M20/M25/M40 family metallo-hydrolase [Candidatus Krumholzibacteriota bacterium]